MALASTREPAPAQPTLVPELPITIADGSLPGALPSYRDDPFDRVLVAQAQRHGLTFVTRDAALSEYGIPLLNA